MNELVALNKNEKPTTTSLLIAEKFGKPHNDVLKAIRKTISDCEKNKISLGNISQCSYKKNGRKFPFFELDRDTFTFVVMSFSGKNALKFKADYIKQFNRMEHKLRDILVGRQSSEWNTARIDGKMQRRKLTDILAPFQIYSLNQGSKGTAFNAYSNFTRLINKAMAIKAGQREILTDDALRRVMNLEYMIENKVKELMGQQVYCKEIYKQCKALMENFTKMVPYTGEIYLPKSEQVELLEATA